jgi:hypothetical protein
VRLIPGRRSDSAATGNTRSPPAPPQSAPSSGSLKGRLLAVFQTQDLTLGEARVLFPHVNPQTVNSVAHDRNTLAPKNKAGKGRSAYMVP